MCGLSYIHVQTSAPHSSVFPPYWHYQYNYSISTMKVIQARQNTSFQFVYRYRYISIYTGTVNIYQVTTDTPVGASNCHPHITSYGFVVSYTWVKPFIAPYKRKWGSHDQGLLGCYFLLRSKKRRSVFQLLALKLAFDFLCDFSSVQLVQLLQGKQRWEPCTMTATFIDACQLLVCLCKGSCSRKKFTVWN